MIGVFSYRLEKLADAKRNRIILEAEAEAESLRLKGEAEAYAIEVKAKAEADQMQKKAEAWKEYKEAAMIDMMLDCLPKVKTIYLARLEVLNAALLTCCSLVCFCTVLVCVYSFS